MEKVTTVCPYCAAGCKLRLVVDDGMVVGAEAAMGKNNQGTLCLKAIMAGTSLTIPRS